MKVLFVDDEPNILSGLRRMLRPHTKGWDLCFAESGPDALEMIDSQGVDVIVSDMRMPGMDGATLLAAVRDRTPEVVRIVLSGHSEATMSMRSAQVAHQFLTKPCDPQLLTATIMRACELQSQMNSPVLRSVVGELSALPSPPQVVIDLQALLAAREPSLDRVADVVATDPALAAKLLQLVNSAFFGLGQRLTSVRDAVSYLGINTLSTLVTALSAFDQFNRTDVTPTVLMSEQSHALRHSNIMRDLLPSGRAANDAFVVGLLHDIGTLVFMTALPDGHRQARSIAVEQQVHIADAELEVFGTTHAQLGAYLLSLWGLPTEVIEAVAMHHHAPELAHRSVDLTHAAFIAEALEAEISGRSHLGGLPTILDPGYVDELGLTDTVDEIRRRAGG